MKDSKIYQNNFDLELRIWSIAITGLYICNHIHLWKNYKPNKSIKQCSMVADEA